VRWASTARAAPLHPALRTAPFLPHLRSAWRCGHANVVERPVPDHGPYVASGEPTMLLDGFDHVAILTNNTERFHAFYRDVFDAE